MIIQLLKDVFFGVRKVKLKNSKHSQPPPTCRIVFPDENLSYNEWTKAMKVSSHYVKYSEGSTIEVK